MAVADSALVWLGPKRERVQIGADTAPLQDRMQSALKVQLFNRLMGLERDFKTIF